MHSAQTLLAAGLALSLLSAGIASAEVENPCALPTGGVTASEEASGLAGTGIAAEEPEVRLAGGNEDSGMGGTGLDGGEPDGMGGTGLVGGESDGMGGTGVVGTITGFGSICVNGLRITYDADTPTELNGASANSADLALGDVVRVSARTDPETGELRASAIGVRHLVRGPVEALDAAAGTLALLGQQVVLPDEWDAKTLEALIVGDHVAVSGQRRSDGSILASRLVLLDARDAASLIGALEFENDGRVRVAGVPVEAETSIAADLAGEYVVATGVWDPTTRSIRSAEIEGAVAFDAETTSEISVGGFVEASDAESLRVGGVRVEAPRALFEQLDSARIDDYILIRAVLTPGGDIRAVRIGLDARPPRMMIPRPPRIQRLDRPNRVKRIRTKRPPQPPRPPRIDVPQRPVRILKRISR